MIMEVMKYDTIYQIPLFNGCVYSKIKKEGKEYLMADLDGEAVLLDCLNK